jgi:N-acyl-D-aspartate/D-glutamate deacylase
MDVDVALLGGLYFDGTGAAAAARDVAVVGGRVAAVVPAGQGRAWSAGQVIEAAGCWVTPGFLDTHTHYDAEVLATPRLEESVRHGVTSVILGSCSLSTVLSSAEDCADMFSRVEALPREHVLRILEREKAWTEPRAYLDALSKKPLGANVASFLGHSDLRASVMGLGRAVDAREKPTEAELRRMEHLLEDALDAGFLGMSVMTNPWDKMDGDRYRSKALPSTFATWGELGRLAAVLRRRGAILQGAPNITTKLNVLNFAAQSAGWGVRPPLKTALISAADPKADPWLVSLVLTTTRLVNELLGADLKWQTLPVPFEVYADGMDLVIFEEFGAGEAALHIKDALVRGELLDSPSYRRWFRQELEMKFTPRVWHRDLGDAWITEAPEAELVGKSFGGVAQARGLHPADLFLDLMVAHGPKLRWRTVIANHRPARLRASMEDPNVQVSFSDAGAHVRNMAFYDFPLHLLRMAHQAPSSGLTPERAVHRLTGELAAWHNLDAGRIREGDRADIAVIRPEALGALDGYHEAPMEMLGGLRRMVKRNEGAVAATLVGGRVAWRGEEYAEGYGVEFGGGEVLRAKG